MHIINEKPQLDYISEAHIMAKRHDKEQKNRYNNAIEIYSCFGKFETANFETQKHKMKYIITFNIGTLYNNLCKDCISGLIYINSTERISSKLEARDTQTKLQIITIGTAEFCFCPLVRQDWN